MHRRNNEPATSTANCERTNRKKATHEWFFDLAMLLVHLIQLGGRASDTYYSWMHHFMCALGQHRQACVPSDWNSWQTTFPLLHHLHAYLYAAAMIKTLSLPFWVARSLTSPDNGRRSSISCDGWPGTCTHSVHLFGWNNRCVDHTIQSMPRNMVAKHKVFLCASLQIDRFANIIFNWSL